jgi:2-hydroxychromene-2-carboxylate isomerase
MGSRSSWKVFLDLQCAYSKRFWEKLPEIRERFGDEYHITTHLTSLNFHPQAFAAHCAAALVGHKKGSEARAIYEAACFEHQDTYMNAALGDCRKSDVSAVFCQIAEDAGLLDEDTITTTGGQESLFTRDYFLKHCNDWELAAKPAYTEHKVALAYGVYGTPKHVIDETLIPDTESSWGPDKWSEVLENLKK